MRRTGPLQLTVAFAALLGGLVATAQAGDFERLYYDGIAGVPMDNFRNAVDPARTPTDPADAVYATFPTGASFSEMVSSGLNRVTLAGTATDKFGSLVRGYLQAPMDGAYVFHVAADNSAELYLSGDHTPLDRKAAGNFLSQKPAPIAFEDGSIGCCTALFSGARLEERSSGPITLQKGKLYYFEAYHKQSATTAWLEVGWERPDGVKEVIPANALFPFIFPESSFFSAAAGITAGPVSVTARENFPATFAVSVVMPPPLTFQWFENGVAIPGATLSYLTIPAATRGLDGHKYSVKVNTTTSAEAVLTVTSDVSKPTIVTARGSGIPHGVLVTYAKPMEAASVTNAANYSVTGQALTVAGVDLISPTQVLVKVSDFNTTPFSLVVSNVKDATVAGSVIAANTTASVDLTMHDLVVAKFFGGLARGDDGTGASETARTRGLPNFPDSPTWYGSVDGIDVPQTSATFGPGGDVNDFQTYVKGYFNPVVSGDYKFFFASDDPGAFYLSPDSNFAHLPAVDAPTLFEDGCCRAIGTEGDGLSTTVALEAGKQYAFEAYSAEYGGGDFMQMGWTPPGGSSVAVIPSSFVSTIWPSAALAISQQPANKTVLENTSATFSVAVTGVDPFVVVYQWYRNGKAIPGATGSSYTISGATLADNGAKFAVTAANRNGTFALLTSAEAILTVSNDTAGPTITKAAGDGSFTKIYLTYSEPVELASATSLGNYVLSGGLTLSGASLSADAKTVTLTTSVQTQGTAYTIKVSGVKDVSPNQNLIVANTTVSFNSWIFGKGFVKWESYHNITTTAITALTGSPKFPNSPDETLFLSRFDSRTVRPDDSRENYGARVSGWFVPEKTGDYVFFLASDDSSQLFLSPDDKEANKVVVAEQTGCCNAFSVTPPLSSAPITMTAGKRYYIEALVKEGGGGDWLKVAMKGPGEDLTTPPPTSANTVVDLATIPGSLLGTYINPDAVLEITQQPTDEQGSVASSGVPFTAKTFDADDGGMTVVTTGEPPGPWRYDAGMGAWVADNGNDGCGTPNNSALNSPAFTMAQDGALTLKFKHRYSFEPTYDGGQVRLSVNGGAFAEVPVSSFLENGYSAGNIVGAGVLSGKRAFSGDSAGYAAGTLITSTASLGAFKKRDTVVVEFLAGWDECSTGTIPNWVLDGFTLDLLPMSIQDFAVNDGGFTVETEGTPPGPWRYDAAKGSWIADNGNDACGTPNNSKLTSKAYVAPQDDEVTLTFNHRYSFEPTWDGGQVQVSVNGGAFAAVSAESFTANGYASGTLLGNGVLNGKPTFTGDSTGYAKTNYVVSSAILGEFKKGDSIVVRFVAGWDECSTASVPNWQLQGLSLAYGKAAKASTFEAAATATLYGDPIQIGYQWQRDDGAGFVDIPDATSPLLTFYPTQKDLAAKFRLVVTTVGATKTTTTVKLFSGVQVQPEISIAKTGADIVIVYVGTLQSAPTVSGPFEAVANAQSPYKPKADGASMFYRSVR